MSNDFMSEEIVHMVRCVAADCIQEMDQQYKEYGVTAIQFFVMCKLKEESDIKVTELAQGLNMTNSNLSAILKRMEQAGYVERVRSVKDQRVVHVSLSKSGDELLKSIDSRTIARKSLFERATQEERKHIFKSLEIVKRLIEEEKYE